MGLFIQILLWCFLVASVWYFRAKADRNFSYGFSSGWDKGFDQGRKYLYAVLADMETSNLKKVKVARQDSFMLGWLTGFEDGLERNPIPQDTSAVAQARADFADTVARTPAHTFRPGSKQAQLVTLMSDGYARTARAIGANIYGEDNAHNTARAGSLIRSLRPVFDIVFEDGAYRMPGSR